MTKKHIILIIVSVLTIAIVSVFFIIKNISDNDLGDMEWIDEKPNELDEDLLFKDVSRNYLASNYIEFLTMRGIMSASGDENFYPENEVTYEEFIDALVLASFRGINFDESLGDAFEEEVKLLEDSNVLAKNQITNSDRSKLIKKIDVATILAKADIKVKNNKQKMVDLLFTDLKDLDTVNQTLLSHSVARGFFINETKKFYPNSSITRADLAEVLYCFMNK